MELDLALFFDRTLGSGDGPNPNVPINPDQRRVAITFDGRQYIYHVPCSYSVADIRDWAHIVFDGDFEPLDDDDIDIGD